MTAASNPLQPFLDDPGVVILDGGLATTLEAHGHRLDDPLWSARVLLEALQALRDVHLEFLQAGADCILTSTYQASFAGFARRGLDRKQTIAAFHDSVRIAAEARSAFLAQSTMPRPNAPLVVASIGPHAASLADGSEYSGHTSLAAPELLEFHRERFELLADSAADLLACETIGTLVELRVLLDLFRANSRVYGWCSVTCGPEARLRDGTDVAVAFAGCDDIANLVAVAVNCTAPQDVSACIERLASTTGKPIFVYPNSGETWEPKRRAWSGGGAGDWAGWARQWRAQGARGVGGCCRVTPEDIATMRATLLAT